MLRNKKLDFLRSYIHLKKVEIDSKREQVFSLKSAVEEIEESVEKLRISITDGETELRKSMVALRPLDLATRQLRVLALEKCRNELDIETNRHESVSSELEACMGELLEKCKYSDCLKDFEEELKAKLVSEHNKAIERDVEELFQARRGSTYDIF